jgi:hypothetical protein
MATEQGTPLPQFDESMTLYEIANQAQEAMNILEKRLDSVERTIRNDAYVVSNVSTTRTLDVSTATTSDVANFVATLVQDLIDRQMLVGDPRYG